MSLLNVLNAASQESDTDRMLNGMSPRAMALLGLLVFQTVRRSRQSSRKASSGARRLKDLLEAAQAGRSVGGGLGTMVSAGLHDLQRQFQAAGKGDVVQSWIGTGANQPIAPQDLAKVLTNEQMELLSGSTGLAREELLRDLSSLLPIAVDYLTRNGRLPTCGEADNLL